MAMSRQDAINDALARLSDLGFTYGPNYAEHGPMAAEAISTLGHNDAVADWVEAYKKDHRPHPLPPRCQPIDGADDWRPALGNRSRLSDWYDHFRQELAANASHDVVRKWAPRLIDGHAGALTHGLIRTSHAVRGLPVDGEPTQLQLDELARGLAYWAGTYQTPSRRADPTPLVASPDAAQDGAGAALSRHTAFLGRVLLTHIERPITPVIQLVHTITSAAAIRTLLPLLPCEFAEDAYEAAQRVSADILARVATASLVMTDTAPPHCQLPWSDLAARAVTHGDEHVIKLTDACLHEDFIRPDPVYRAVAEAIQRCLPASS